MLSSRGSGTERRIFAEHAYFYGDVHDELRLEAGEWKALRSWGRLPPWEIKPVGYLMESNPTVEFIRKWAEACGQKARIELA